MSNFAGRILSFKIYLDERDLQQINMCFVMEHSTADNAKYDIIGENCALERDEVDSSRSGVNHIYICSLNVTEDNLYEVDSTSIIDIMEDIDGTCMNTIIASEIREESSNSNEQNKKEKGKTKNLEKENGPNVFVDSYTVSPNGRRIAVSIYDNNSRLSASIYHADLDDFKTKKGSGNSSNEDNRDANDNEANSSALVRRSDNITREKSYAEVSRSNVNENPFVPSIETMDHPPGDYQGPLKILCFHDDVRGIHSNPVFSPDNSLIAGLFSRTDSSRHEITLLYVHFFNEYSSCWQGMRLLSDLSFESVLWDSDSENGSDEPRMNDLILRNRDGSIDEHIEQHFTLYATARFRGNPTLKHTRFIKNGISTKFYNFMNIFRCVQNI